MATLVVYVFLGLSFETSKRFSRIYEKKEGNNEISLKDQEGSLSKNNNNDRHHIDDDHDDDDDHNDNDDDDDDDDHDDDDDDDNDNYISVITTRKVTG